MKRAYEVLALIVFVTVCLFLGYDLYVGVTLS